MRQFRFLIGYLTYIMQQSGTFLLFFGLSPSSDAITAQRLAVSRACCKRFWPYEERYFILPICDMSGCRPTLGRNQKTLMAVTGAVLPDY